METTYRSLAGQEVALAETIPGDQGRNVQAISAYEQTMLAVVEHPEELLCAYAREEDSRVYIVAVNGSVVAVNNRRSIIAYLGRLPAGSNGSSVLVHCLGTAMNAGLPDELAERTLVS